MRFLAALILAAPLAFAFTEPNPEAEQAAKRAVVPKGLSVSLWAAEPLLANPVAFSFDEQGRCYIAETTRFENGVPDTRQHMRWLDDDLAIRTIDDRLAMYKKHKYSGYEQFDDQVRRVWDSTGKGVADKSVIFAKGFNQLKDGLGSGVLARKNDVFYTNIPSLYRLKDLDADGVADKQDELSTGYGLHVQYLGHDLHGLRMGPDGRLYFTIGDRGLNVINKEGKHLFNPDSGAVLRCEPDGSKLEIVHIGLRNPQELAFDNFGNLFTYDNNCDSGDRARWVQVVPGGDSGWRCGYQYGTLYGDRGPWNTEKLWHTQHADQPAWIVPPLTHFGNGPSGITHYPGLGLNEKYQDHFFACDFTSNLGSVIWSLAVKPKGASFEVVNLEPFVKNMVPTDCEFGPDGAFYWSDWTGGWKPPNKGRIFKVTDPEAMKNPLVKEAQELLAGGMSRKTLLELLKLIEHPHQVVRQEAQYELANAAIKNKDIMIGIGKYLAESKHQLGRMHAVWALGQIYRSNKEDPLELAKLLKDNDAIIRGHAALTLGDSAGGWGYHHEALIHMLRDPEPAVRAKAAYGLARMLKTMAIPTAVHGPILWFAEATGDDPYLRHAAIVLLSCYDEGHVDNLLFAPGQLNRDAKLIVAVALRRIGGTAAALRLAAMLDDPDIAVASEAARSIYDANMEVGMTYLAVMANKPKQPDAVLARAFAANYLVGKPENAKRLAEFAAKSAAPAHLRIIALKLLADFAKPTRRDPINGLTVKLPERDAKIVAEAVKPVLREIFAGSDKVRAAAVACVRKLGIKEVGPVLADVVVDAKAAVASRVEALFALQELNAKELGEVLTVAALAAEPKLRGAARVVRLRGNPKVAEEFADILDKDSTSLVEKQMMFAALGPLPESVAADKILGDWLDKLKAGTAPPEVMLEILEAAEARTKANKLKLHSDLKGKLATYVKQVKAAAGESLVKRFPEALAGGDAANGREIFLTNLAVACQKCHKLDGAGGEVGPPMNGLGKEKTREYLRESIVSPNAQIAKDYQSVILNLANGKAVSGVLKSKTDKEYTLATPENKILVIPAGEVESEKPDKSAMPEDEYKKLSRRELRDLVEFLASLKESK